MAEASWIKPNEVWCPKCGTGHAPTVGAGGAVVVECDHDLSKDEQRAKYIASHAGDGSAVGQAVDAASAAAAATAGVADAIAQKIAEQVGATVGAAIAKAMSGAPPAGAGNWRGSA